MSLFDTSFAVIHGKTFQSSSCHAAVLQACSFQPRFYVLASSHKSNEPIMENEAVEKY